MIAQRSRPLAAPRLGFGRLARAGARPSLATRPDQTRPDSWMRTINIQQAKTHLSRLVDEAQAGEDIRIAKAGRPCVRLVPVMANESPRELGRLRGQVFIADDFDAPSPRSKRCSGSVRSSHGARRSPRDGPHPSADARPAPDAPAPRYARRPLGRHRSRTALGLDADPIHLFIPGPLAQRGLCVGDGERATGKLITPAAFDAELERLRLEELPVRLAHTRELRGLPDHHKDPFDRILDRRQSDPPLPGPDDGCLSTDGSDRPADDRRGLSAIRRVASSPIEAQKPGTSLEGGGSIQTAPLWAQVVPSKAHAVRAGIPPSSSATKCGSLSPKPPMSTPSGRTAKVLVDRGASLRAVSMRATRLSLVRRVRGVLAGLRADPSDPRTTRQTPQTTRQGPRETRQGPPRAAMRLETKGHAADARGERVTRRRARVAGRVR